ncbi:MAG: hypothetical protein PF630_00315 [Gammaproteobacteria bacterium]|jgi:hypothetical protein|nr:hypothetical protein [Gammaproteobacteria bacterium]
MDVFIFQMGKVGSSAITGAMLAQGLNAVQMHWLGRDQLMASLEHDLLDLNKDDDVALRGLDGYAQNIANARRLMWYQRHKRKDGQRLRIVTLARDPMDWYWGHLAENFDLYSVAMLDWYRQVIDPHVESEQIMLVTETFHRALFECFGRVRRRVDHPRFNVAAGKQKVNGIHQHFLCQQLMKLRLPTAWFDAFFKPPLGIDIFRTPLDAESGLARYETDFCKVLLIQYDNLQQSLTELGRFVGLDHLQLQQVNRSEDKPVPFSISALRQRITPDAAMIRRLYATRYCRYFCYKPGL